MRTNVLNLATCEQTQLTLQLSTGQDRPSDIKFLAAAVPELSMKGASTGSHDPPESAPFASLASAAARQGPQSSTKRRTTEALRCIPGPRRSSNFLRRASKRLETSRKSRNNFCLLNTLRDSASETGNISNFETTHWIQLENIAFCREKQRKIMENLYAGHCSWWLLANGKPRNSGQDFLRMDWTWDYVLLFLQVKLNSTFSNI